MTPKDIPGNGHTLAKIDQKLEDHINGQIGQFSRVDDELASLNKKVECLLADRASKFEGWMRSLLPIVISVLVLVLGWVYGISKVEAKVSELEGGRIENRANIQLLHQQFEEKAIQDALRDERYKVILERLQIIQDKLNRLK